MRDDLLEFNPNPQLIARKLNELLKNEKYSTVGLAAHCGVSERAVRNWRNGNQSIGSKNLVLVANYFGIDQRNLLPRRNDLINFIDEKKREKKKAQEEILKRLRR